MVQFRVGSVPEHFTLPWHLAQESGAFQKQGVAIDWQDYPNGTGAMMADLREGKLDIAVALTEGVVADIIQHQSGKIAQLFVTSPLTWGIHVASGSSYQQVDELEGKTFAISRMGSGSHLMAFVMAKQLGWSTEDLPLEIVGGMDGARKALASGDADVFMWEKFMTKPVVDSGEFRRVGEFDTPWPCFAVVVRNETLADHSVEVETLLEVVQKSALDFMELPDASQLVAQRYHLNIEDAQEWFERTKWATDFAIEADTLRLVMDSLVECKVINSKLEPSQLCSKLAQLK
uniref:Substrate-binding domain-containing protein n=1 Tax=Roseihalotalea indica TaxID=2867963 RepID=A0AA49GST3_9BACT|nr:substrate-binding domain-containing protein [Tunicatimonas sp. TK19036]